VENSYHLIALDKTRYLQSLANEIAGSAVSEGGPDVFQIALQTHPPLGNLVIK